MNGFGLKFHHLGLATRMPEQSIKMLTGLGYTSGQEPVYDPLQHVTLSLFEHERMPAVEVVSGDEADEQSPIAGILENTRQMLYHQCYATDNRQESLRAIGNGGLRVLPVAEPKPAILFNGRLVSFYMVVGFGLIELLESP